MTHIFLRLLITRTAAWLCGATSTILLILRLNPDVVFILCLYNFFFLPHRRRPSTGRFFSTPTSISGIIGLWRLHGPRDSNSSLDASCIMMINGRVLCRLQVVYFFTPPPCIHKTPPPTSCCVHGEIFSTRASFLKI